MVLKNRSGPYFQEDERDDDDRRTATKDGGKAIFSKTPTNETDAFFTETQLTEILSDDGCEDCIVCPLHKTAFALSSGEVRGEWCPYPPILGKLVGTIKAPTNAATFDIRTRGKMVEVRINTPL
jgi:nitrite reductase/ring-hydroxylating ferredoxin subunit